MTGLLLRYNKVHNDALQKLEPKLRKKFEAIWGDLEDLNGPADLHSVASLSDYFDSLTFDFIIVGDVFWRTGQNICKICRERNIPVFFLQHGQWIYTKNKMSLLHYPTYTFLFGDFIGNLCASWTYAKFSECIVTGSPRYDEVEHSRGVSQYLYFAPPVLEEIVHNKPSGIIRKQAMRALFSLRGIDKEFCIVVQPHYREARIDVLRDMFPAAQFADPALDPFKLIRGASKVITSRDSTSVLDAIAHRKMVVLTDNPDTKSFFLKNHFGEFARENENKQEFIKQTNTDYRFKGNNYVQRARKYVYLGDASTRIVEFMYNVLYQEPCLEQAGFMKGETQGLKTLG